MDWVVIVWTGATSAPLMLAGIHFFVWMRNRAALASLLFSLMAACTAGMAGCALSTIRVCHVVNTRPHPQSGNSFCVGGAPGPYGLSDFYGRTGPVLHAWPPRSISQSLCALSKLGFPGGLPLSWIKGLCMQTRGSLSSYDPQSMANLTWALATLPHGECVCVCLR